MRTIARLGTRAGLRSEVAILRQTVERAIVRVAQRAGTGWALCAVVRAIVLGLATSGDGRVDAIVIQVIREQLQALGVVCP